MSSRWKYLISLFAAIILGLNLFYRIDPPPYGHPLNELSDNYWGVITHIAHCWRNFDIRLWSRELGGGIDLFSSGQYPLLNPTNALAWILNDDTFVMFKIIEPYVLGFFFMTIVLWDIFQTRWYVAFFGGLAYMGLTIAKATTMAESPYFLYACGLFPGMIFTALKLIPRNSYLAAIGVGSLLALQFLGEGAIQMPQLIVWWTIFFTFYYIGELSSGRIAVTIKRWAVIIGIFVGAAFGLCAVQFLPTMHFFNFESARIGGHYLINNFPLFHPSETCTYPLSQIIFKGFFETPLRAKAFLCLLWTTLALALMNIGCVFKNTPQRKCVYLIWASTLMYFLIPPTADFLVNIAPALKGIFKSFTNFTFMYGLHILDFCIVLTICLIMNNETLTIVKRNRPSWINLMGVIVFLVLGTTAFLPVITTLWPAIKTAFPVTSLFATDNVKHAMKFSIQTLILIFLVAFRPLNRIRHGILAVLLLGGGFMMTLDCIKWYDKGCRVFPEEFQLQSPEHKYFQHAQGKYTMPYNFLEPAWSIHNYNLLYGVHGTSGFMAMAPMRLGKFSFYYNNRLREDIVQIPFMGNSAQFTSLNDPVPSSFTSFFPIDFTLVDKNISLPWEGFQKTVSGDRYDVYERKKPTAQVYFADALNMLPIEDVIRKFDSPRPDTVYVTHEDALRAGLSEKHFNTDLAKTMYRNFKREHEGRLSFETFSEGQTFVIVPERYAQGWQLRIDGKKSAMFPAYYLFIGFEVPGGIHKVELTYICPWLLWGTLINLLSIAAVLLFVVPAWVRDRKSG